MKKEVFKMIRHYYNSNLVLYGLDEKSRSNICGFLNAMFMIGEIDAGEYGKIIKHFKTGKKLTLKAMK